MKSFKVPFLVLLVGACGMLHADAHDGSIVGLETDLPSDFIADDHGHPDQMRTRAGKQTVSVIFQGLSQSCAQLGQVVAAQTEQEKQQGALNIMSTVFGVVAALSAQPKNQNPLPDHVTVKLADLTTLLVDELDKSPSRAPLSDLLALIKKLPMQADRRAMVKIILSSVHAEQFLRQLCTALQDYLVHHMPDLLQLFSNYVVSDSNELSTPAIS